MKDKKLEYIFRQYRKLVLETAYGVLKDYHLAQDVCQDVFIKLSPERMELAEKPEEMKRYFRIVAYRRAIDYYRIIERRDEVSLESTNAHEALVTDPLDVENKVACEMFAETLFKDLKEKNAEWYEIVVRLGLYDEPVEIVARDLGISTTLLRTKYHRARKWIGRNYKSEYGLLKDS